MSTPTNSQGPDHAQAEAQPPTPTRPMALIAVAHGKATILCPWLNDDVEQHIDSVGEELALEEALSSPKDGIWVVELSLVDDGPSDWSPEFRECRLEASNARPPTAEEWSSYANDEEVWHGEPCTCDDGTVWLSEQDLVDELKAERGTGEPIKLTFGFNGKSRTWRACPLCPAGAEKAGRS